MPSVALAKEGRPEFRAISTLRRLTARLTLAGMSPLEEIEVRAQGLPPSQRARLAASLLASLPPVLSDEDEGLAVARQRDAELDRDPALQCSAAEFRRAVSAARDR